MFKFLELGHWGLTVWEINMTIKVSEIPNVFGKDCPYWVMINMIHNQRRQGNDVSKQAYNMFKHK